MYLVFFSCLLRMALKCSYYKLRNKFYVCCCRYYSVLPVPPTDADVGFQPGPSNQTEIFSETVGDQNTGLSNQRQPLSEAVDLQHPGASNQTDILDRTVDFGEPAPSNQTDVLDRTVDLGEPGLSNQTEDIDRRQTDQISPHSVPEFEVMRDATHDFSPGNIPPLFSDHVHDVTEPLGSPDKNLNEKEVHTPNLEDVLESGGLSLHYQQLTEPPASAASQEAPEIFDTHISLGRYMFPII